MKKIKMMGNEKKSLRSIRKRRGKKRGIGKQILIWTSISLLLLIVAGAGFIYFLVDGLPSIASLKDYRPSIITRVYANDGQL
ncbi:MAG TPA: hypothetical protein PLA74_09930, partial [Syntrophales bacterium]|nr:hypothetical protein [Syntrophales bacterium]